MKKRIAGILISILALSALSGCGKEKDISYVDEPATTSDAATASLLHRNYEVTDGLRHLRWMPMSIPVYRHKVPLW